MATATVVNGYDMLSGTANPNGATVFVVLKSWSEREKTAAEIVKLSNGIMAKNITEATVFALAYTNSGLGSSAGFTLMIQDKEWTITRISC